MTTGRINQVTILQARVPRKRSDLLTGKTAAWNPRRGRKLVVHHGWDGAFWLGKTARPTGDRARTPAKGWPSLRSVIQLPPLSSPRDGPSQRTRSAPRGTTTRLWHLPLKRRIPDGRSRRNRRLPTAAYPQKS